MLTAIDILRKLPGAAVLCVGDIMLDNFVYGSAERLSPEAPIPVVLVKKKISVPGGMGNVVRNLGEVGVLPLAVSVSGDDEHANALARLFGQSGWLPPIIIRDPDRPTIVKTRIIAGRQQVVRFDEEAKTPLAPDTETKLIEAVKRHIGGVRAVALSDYGKGVVTPRVAEAVSALAREKGLPVVVDPKGVDYGKYAGVTVVTPNRKELSEAAGREVYTAEEITAAGRELLERHDIANLLVTRSEAGMLLVARGDGGVFSATAFPALAREVADVSGAGDTVVAMTAAALAVGGGMELAAKLATLAAGVVVGKIGTAVALPQEIEDEAKRWNFAFPDAAN